LTDSLSLSRAQVLCNLPPDRFHACDTEVADINLEKEGPVGHGVVTCASVYSGPDVDFGNGPKLWIDNLDGAEVWPWRAV
jgi:DNA polymerase I